jgi:hypothetical protein
VETTPTVTSVQTSQTDPNPISSSTSSVGSFLDQGLDLFTNSLIFFLLGLMLLMVVIVRSRGKEIPPEFHLKRKRDHQQPYTSTDKTREMIITQYLEISNLLERQGADSDWSLTPKEFEDDVHNRFMGLHEFDDITDIYELARFSKNKITNEKIAQIKKASEDVRSKFDESDESEELELSQNNEKPEN